ncbi:hypothetical protein CK203_092821 [Vitis vinifera]|uniref:Enhancer of polycomb-like protein n=1 Tax=Vitis vinifera TaxID=29760 RepID=A0A438DFC8_VITVI|nr:hypothetical protein CK203_092821 [Vitis vinifera]
MRTCSEFGFRTESASQLTESPGEIEARVAVAAPVRGRTAMPSVGMRRTTRVFVPKTAAKGAAGGARVLRSGRRLWPDSGEGKLTRDADWFRLLHNSGGGGGGAGGGGGLKENGWHEVNSKQEVDDVDAEVAVSESRNVAGKCGDDQGSDYSRWGIVYSRRTKRSDSKSLLSPEKKRGFEDKRFGIRFSRKQRRKRMEESEEGGYVCVEMVTVVIDSSRSGRCRFTSFLNSILGYMRRSRVRLWGLYEFLTWEPMMDAFSSHGVRFLRDPPCARSFGICKIFGARRFIPLFSVDFSAVPSCFMYLHSSMLLRFGCLPFVLVNNSMSVCSNGEEPIDSEENLLCIPSKKDHFGSKSITLENDNSGKRRMLQPTIGTSRFSGRNAQWRNGVNSRSIQKRRSSQRSRRVRNPSLVGIHKSNGALVSDFITNRNKGIPFSSVVYNQELRRSARHASATNIRELKSTSVVVKEEIDSVCCSANILIVESDRCFRENGANVMLEVSASKEWFIAVKKDGSMKYSHKAEKDMRYASNRHTHAMIWNGEDGWKLEFPNRQDWMIFKELYKECCDRNVEAPSVKIIPVPGNDEVSRAMAKTTASYDMDSEDEEWLKKLNNDYPDANGAADLCVDLGSREAIACVYGYWMKKRKRKRGSLVRVFQGHHLRKAQLIPKPVLRKKRSFSRQVGKFGRGKQQNVMQALAAQRKAIDETSAKLKAQEARVSLDRSEKLAIRKRVRAQSLMENADLATYRAAMALRIAEATRLSESPFLAADDANFLD